MYVESSGLQGCLTSRGLRYTASFLGFACGVAVIAAAVVGLLNKSLFDLRSVIVGVFQIALGTMMILAELRVRPWLKWFRFMIPYFGLGLFYLVVAIFALQRGAWWQIAVSAVTAAVGAMYLLFSCLGAHRHVEMDAVDQATLRDSVASKIARREHSAALAAAEAEASGYGAAAARNKLRHAPPGGEEDVKADRDDGNPFRNQPERGGSAYTGGGAY